MLTSFRALLTFAVALALATNWPQGGVWLASRPTDMRVMRTLADDGRLDRC